MINKQKLWFLTLFSIILVLSVYYVSMPGESLSNLIKSSDTSSEKTTIKTNNEDSLAALRVSNDEEVLAEMAKLQETLLDTAASSEDKNNAYEKLLSINLNKGKETSLEELILLEEEDFFDFQNCIRNCLGMESRKPYIFETNEKIRKMKAKARYRDKIKAKQASKNGEAPSLSTLLASICCMGIGLTPLNIGEISYASMQKILNTYQKHEKYENDIKSLMVGAKAKELDFKYWIRNSD